MLAYASVLVPYCRSGGLQWSRDWLDVLGTRRTAYHRDLCPGADVITAFAQSGSSFDRVWLQEKSGASVSDGLLADVSSGISPTQIVKVRRQLVMMSP